MNEEERLAEIKLRLADARLGCCDYYSTRRLSTDDIAWLVEQIERLQLVCLWLNHPLGMTLRQYADLLRVNGETGFEALLNDWRTGAEAARKRLEAR